ncbi:methyltransferase (TIGR00027 family) [Methanolinea mesophila]|uniref:SAM-dependent methyltransferase n=1 Tax=Methanolinea mesophila TaxID=547055 RepID=UPI001AE20229|nr:class I SAM-dependent methyltransferase [Methanolinea mesophila]MBP1927816.1 methyltransferase (TIGR00027 family) [Methanolinea mesophila]
MEEIQREFGTRKTLTDPSKTAELVVLRRVSESLRPEEERICYDPYAVRFIDPAILAAAREHPEERKKKALEVERVFPGLAGSIVARVRYFDDFVTTVAATGIPQVVILGAGYDSRAYRIPGLAGVRVFEVDHPLTQRIKKERVRGIFGTLPDHVAYVPADFGRDSLFDTLDAAGYTRTLPTLFILEGLTMYLSPVIVDDIFSFIVRNSGKGSVVLFDYYPLSLVDGTDTRQIAGNIREFSKGAGEPIQFGVPDGEIAGFLADRGFVEIRSVTSEEYRALYFDGKKAGRLTTDLIAFAVARVP